MAGALGEGDRRRGIQSVETGLRVLMALASYPGPATLSAIAQRAELSASQTHRYLSSLIVSGMARQENRSGLYDLDAGAIRLGLSALSRLDMFAAADTVFQALARETRRTCLLAVWGDGGPTIIRWFMGSPPVVTSMGIGSVFPVLQSATGRVFFAFGEGAQVNHKAAAEARQLKQPLTAFETVRQKTRKNMFAEISGDLIPGLRAYAAPVFDLQGRLACVASLIANSAFRPEEDGEARMALLRACKDLTETLGGVWPEG